MSYLLDTNVISEFTKAPADARVVNWLASVHEPDTYLSVAVVAEIRLGIENRPVNRHGVDLESWFTDDLLPRYEGRVLDVSGDVSQMWGRCLHRLRAAGRTDYAMDALIGATALVHGLTVVTRNLKDFSPLGVPLLDPWSFEG